MSDEYAIQVSLDTSGLEKEFADLRRTLQGLDDGLGELMDTLKGTSKAMGELKNVGKAFGELKMASKEVDGLTNLLNALNGEYKKTEGGAATAVASFLALGKGIKSAKESIKPFTDSYTEIFGKKAAEIMVEGVDSVKKIWRDGGFSDDIVVAAKAGTEAVTALGGSLGKLIPGAILVTGAVAGAAIVGSAIREYIERPAREAREAFDEFRGRVASFNQEAVAEMSSGTVDLGYQNAVYDSHAARSELAGNHMDEATAELRELLMRQAAGETLSGDEVEQVRALYDDIVEGKQELALIEEENAARLLAVSGLNAQNSSREDVRANFAQDYANAVQQEEQTIAALKDARAAEVAAMDEMYLQEIEGKSIREVEKLREEYLAERQEVWNDYNDQIADASGLSVSVASQYRDSFAEAIRADDKIQDAFQGYVSAFETINDTYKEQTSDEYLDLNAGYDPYDRQIWEETALENARTSALGVVAEMGKVLDDESMALLADYSASMDFSEALAGGFEGMEAIIGPELYESFMGLDENVQQLLFEVLTSGLEGAAEPLSDAGSQMGEIGKDVVEQFAQGAEPGPAIIAMEALMEAITGALDDGVTAINNKKGEMLTAVQALVTEVAAEMEKLGPQLQTAVDSVFAAGDSGVNTVGVPGLGSFMNAGGVGDAAGGLSISLPAPDTTELFAALDAIPTKVSGVDLALVVPMDSMNIKFSTLASQATTTTSQISDDFSTMASEITTTLEGVDLYDIGVAITQGLYDGIDSIAGLVLALVDSLANSIIDIIAMVPKVSSPSKVTTEIGAFIGEGLIVGMDSERPGVERSATSLATASLPAPHYSPESTPSIRAAEGGGNVTNNNMPQFSLMIGSGTSTSDRELERKVKAWVAESFGKVIADAERGSSRARVV